jgi:glucose-1-phosphate thymidylyltransferase
MERAVQGEPLGTAEAVLAAEAFAGEDTFVLANADDLYPDEALGALAELDDRTCYLTAFSPDGLVRRGNIGAERIKDFAVVTSSDEGRLLGIVEKPPDPERYARNGRFWVSMNLYRFTAAIFDSCRRIGPDPRRGELELTTAVADLVAADETDFRVLFCEGGVFDLTSRADIPSAERALAGRQLCF